MIIEDLINDLVAPRHVTWQRIVTYHLPILVKAEAAHRWSPLARKLSIQPTTAGLNVTDNCCLRCIMCNEWRQRSRIDDELTTEEWKDIIEQLREAGIQRVGMTGGEPLLRDDLAELISYAHELGLEASVVTNGYLLNERRAEELVAAGLTEISLSVDALGETYDRIRGVKGAHERVQAACQILAELKERYNLRVYILATIMKLTLECLPEVVELAKNLNLTVLLNLIDYTPYFFRLEGNRTSLWIENGEREKLDRLAKWLAKTKREHQQVIGENYVTLEYMNKYFADPLQKDLPCVAALTRIFIDSHGKVFGGCWSMGHLGDLRQSALKDIISSPRYVTAHQRMFFKECPGCSCGYQTNLMYSLRYLIREMRLRIIG